MKRIKRNNKKQRSVQRTIPYKTVNTETGLIEINKGVFSTTLKFEDTNFTIARDTDKEDIFNNYVRLLNYFTEDNSIQITLNNKVRDMEIFEDELLLKCKGDGNDDLREDYNKILKKNLARGKSNMTKEMYFTITTKAKDYLEAEIKLEKAQKEVISNFKKAGSKATVMTVKERLEVLHDFFNPDEVGEFDFNEELINKRGEGSKDTIAPDSIEFCKDYFKIGNKFARGIFVKSLPTTLNTKFIAELLENNKTMMLSINIETMDTDKAIRLIQKQITGMNANKIEYQKKSIKSGYIDAFVPYELKAALEDAEELLEQCTKKNQKLFLVSIVIMHEADTLEQLKEDTEIFKRIAGKNLCKIGTLVYQQEEAFKSILPLGNNELEIDRTLTTDATAAFMPFNSRELIQKFGSFYGRNSTTGNAILLNRRELKNGNAWVLGSPGSGKSFAVKAELASKALSEDCDIIVIDPEGEFGVLINALGGESVKIAPNSKSYINPLDINANYADRAEDPLLLKSEYILSLFQVMVSTREGLTPQEKTVLDRVCRKVYMGSINDGFKKENMPTLMDFQRELENQTEDCAKKLSLSLEMYSKGSLSIFANKTNVNINNNLMCFNIKNLGSQLKSMGMLIILDYIWNRITENRNKNRNTYVYIDECYLLFDNEISANFLYKLFKRSRKYGCLLTCITQNISDLLQSPTATTMLSNSEFIQLLNQSASDRMDLAEILNISENQLSHISAAEPGSGLLICGENAIIPFTNEYPKDSKLYKLMTTKLGETLTEDEIKLMYRESKILQ